MQNTDNEEKANKPEQVEEVKGSKNISKTIHYKTDNDEYDGSLYLDGQLITLSITRAIESLHWKGDYSMKTLVDYDKRWLSLLDEENIFNFMLKSFTNVGVSFMETEDTGLKISFKYQMGYEDILLPIHVKALELDIQQVVKSQGIVIKNLLLEKKEMQNIIRQLLEEVKTLKENSRETFILFNQSIGAPKTTFNEALTDIPGLSASEMTIRRKCKAKWELYISGLYFNNGGGDHKMKFRLELLENKSNKAYYWPSQDGCTGYAYDNTGAHIGCSFSFGDVADLDEGTYTVKLQWGYTSNIPLHAMTYYPSHGDLRVIIDTY